MKARVRVERTPADSVSGTRRTFCVLDFWNFQPLLDRRFGLEGRSVPLDLVLRVRTPPDRQLQTRRCAAGEGVETFKEFRKGFVGRRGIQDDKGERVVSDSREEAIESFDFGLNADVGSGSFSMSAAVRVSEQERRGKRTPGSR